MAFVAARYGVRKGAQLSTEHQRRVQDREDDRERGSLLRMFIYDIGRVEVVPADLKDTDNKIGGMMPTLKDHIDEMCRGYYSRRGSVLLVEGREVQDGIERFYNRLITLRGWIVVWHEEEIGFRGGEGTLPDTSTSPSMVVAGFNDLAKTGRELVRRLREAHPEYDL